MYGIRVAMVTHTFIIIIDPGVAMTTEILVATVTVTTVVVTVTFERLSDTHGVVTMTLDVTMVA